MNALWEYLLTERTKKATKLHVSLSTEQNKGDSLSHHPRSRGGQENGSVDKMSKTL